MEAAMINSRMENKIVYLDVVGDFSADELFSESKKWFDAHKDEYVGYLLDISKMEKHPALEQRKAEALSKQLTTKKPRAVIGKGDVSARFINIYIRFTKAKDIKYFGSLKEAEEWILSYEK
jgi:hypothetical protein